jgi:hypothetical protein
MGIISTLRGRALVLACTIASAQAQTVEINPDLAKVLAAAKQEGK